MRQFTNCQTKENNSKKFSMWMIFLGCAYRVLTLLVIKIISVREFEKYHYKCLTLLQNMNSPYGMNTQVSRLRHSHSQKIARCTLHEKGHDLGGDSIISLLYLEMSPPKPKSYQRFFFFFFPVRNKKYIWVHYLGFASLRTQVICNMFLCLQKGRCQNA